MSKAGIQSNRGDGYQTLVAFGWALSVLSDPDYQWIEVDSVKWSVDDVVIGRADGSKICCQCKKNQADHKAWSIADLADELAKAIALLAKDSTAEVRFYSRSAFGDLSALKELSVNYTDEAAYQLNLGIRHKSSDVALKRLIEQTREPLSTYEFLCRTTFEVSPELDQMIALLHERLRILASKPKAAFDALWTRLDHLGMRTSTQGLSTAVRHRLDNADLKGLLAQAGAMLTPPMNAVEVRTSFKSTSAIGRTWRRDVGNERISSPVVKDLLAAIEAKEQSILLSGLPGSGKTCVMLAVQEELERRAQASSDLLPLFIQAREFADMTTAQDRQTQGLSELWVESVARMAEDSHVVVIIDSLDVLSIAREHVVLTYFLAQIDRLLLISNVTVVTACRDFDRHYDRRIAQRTWAKEFACQPLNWEADIAPLLARLGIDATTIDSTTRTLIRNPRELSLFAELAQRGGSFNVVTSQALAQRYLTTIVQDDSALGDSAMQAIESIATEMLLQRSLSVPSQAFAVSADIRRMLLSQNVLHETADGRLAFGHQTLLDVLVIHGAMRQRLALEAFIQNLPPVPFVRPSIRSFVSQLATGDRREFRKQLRKVLMGAHAFHVRRLVAECLAEQIPLDEDWPLLRDLRNQHREVFQVIYTQATHRGWHHFWSRHLVPVLKDERDAEGVKAHIHRVSCWKNEDAPGVIAFWREALALDWLDKEQSAWPLSHALLDIDQEHSALIAPLLDTLLQLPRQDHSFLGHVLARCVAADGIDDAALWNFIAGDIREEDLLAYNFDKKLRCAPHEFGSSNSSFLGDRMRQSVALLDLAISSIERWSQVKRVRYGVTSTDLWDGFLSDTSHSDAHSQSDHRHISNERILLDAVEAAIVHHARSESAWWQENREHICFSGEGALRYFAVLACTAVPEANLDLIGRMLIDSALLASNLSHELGALMQVAFAGLSPATQDAIQTSILNLHQEIEVDAKHRHWVLIAQSQLILAIPCHLRSPASLGVLDKCSQSTWPLERQPTIHTRGGTVGAPFSFEVFLAASDSAVLRLLAHYNGHTRNSFDEFLVGGEREVGWQLKEAASRHPTRFLKFLPGHWAHISDRFCNDIMDGVATYLAHRYGNLQQNGPWVPVEEPNAHFLAKLVLDELERHPSHWHHNRSASNALQSCAHVVCDAEETERLVLLAIGFSSLREQSSISGDSVDLLTTGINMARGHAAEALMIAANKLVEVNASVNPLLASALRRFAADEHPAIRALMLRRLPYLQSRHFEFGWALFDLAIQPESEGLWLMAEPCLYYAYHRHFETVAPRLLRLGRDGTGKDLEVWGRISALASLSRRIEFSTLLAELKSKNSAEAWEGATSVWANTGNMQQHREECLSGLAEALSAKNPHASSLTQRVSQVFRDTTPLVSVPIALVQRWFALLESDAQPKRHDVYGFDSWLNAFSNRDPSFALDATELYVEFAQRTKVPLYDHENNFTQLLTRLFAQAEEQEATDAGEMLRRVVAIQDALLALGVNGVNDWLQAAERP